MAQWKDNLRGQKRMRGRSKKSDEYRLQWKEEGEKWKSEHMVHESGQRKKKKKNNSVAQGGIP